MMIIMMNYKPLWILTFAAVLALGGCQWKDVKAFNSASQESSDEASEKEAANVTKVSVSGEAESYTFSITIESPDTGCDQYADWWEVLAETGELLYRRILLHSHVNEQPFTRSGGPVEIASDQIVIVRAHMNNTGYAGNMLKGSVDTEFVEFVSEEAFAPDVEIQEPLPENCAF